MLNGSCERAVGRGLSGGQIVQQDRLGCGLDSDGLASAQVHEQEPDPRRQLNGMALDLMEGVNDGSRGPDFGPDPGQPLIRALCSHRGSTLRDQSTGITR